MSKLEWGEDEDETENSRTINAEMAEDDSEDDEDEDDGMDESEDEEDDGMDDSEDDSEDNSEEDSKDRDEDRDPDRDEESEDSDPEHVAERSSAVSEASQKLKDEYNSTFDGEELANQQLIKIKSKINVHQETVDIDNIIVSKFKQEAREDTLLGLTSIVKEWGVISEVHVLKLEDDDMYMLLDGLRRIFAAKRNGEKVIKVTIWDFEDKAEGKQLANLISLMINMSQRFSVKEQWNMLQKLESNNQAAPGLIEYLLQMQSGDAMKLKDVMASDAEFAEIKADLMSGQLSIEMAYKKLCKQRKDEDRLAKADERGLDIDKNDESTEDESELTANQTKLSIDEVKDVLGLLNNDVEDMSLSDLDRTDEVRGNMVQSTSDRHVLPTELKQSVLIRDDFKCQCCGTGGKQWLGVLVVHHVVPVAASGPDLEDNLVTLCQNCHMQVHLYIFGKIMLDLGALSEKESKVFKNIFKYGNVAIEAFKRSGMSKKKAYDKDASSRQHAFPGAGLSDTKDAFQHAKG